MLDEGAVAFNTVLGWAIQGQISMTAVSTPAVVTFLTSHELTLDEKVSSFWSVQGMPCSNPQPHDDMEFFRPMVKFKEGHYEVPLLWKGSDQPTCNFTAAMRQYTIQRWKAERNGSWAPYTKVMEVYIEFGTIESDPEAVPGVGYYLPHHPVQCVMKVRLTH